MTSPNHRLSLEEVLDEFFFATEKPNANMVLRACEAHPEFSEDIMEFAALWTVYETAEDPTEVFQPSTVADQDVSSLQSYVLTRLHQTNPTTQSTDSDIEAATKAVSTLAGGALRRAAAASRLGSATILLQKILTNSITNIPASVLAALSVHLNVAMAGLQMAIAGRTQLVGRHYSSKNKPAVPQKESWENAVRSLSLPKDELDRLLQLLDEE